MPGFTIRSGQPQPNVKTVRTSSHPLGVGDFTTLQAWEDYASSQSHPFQWAECYEGGNIGTVTIQSWSSTPLASGYPRVFAASGEYHGGNVNRGVTLNGAEGTSNDIKVSYTRFEQMRSNAGIHVDTTSATNVLVQNCIVTSDRGSNFKALTELNASTFPSSGNLFYNCLSVGGPNPSGLLNYGFRLGAKNALAGQTQISAINCTAVGHNQIGFELNNTNIGGVGGSYVNAINCLSVANSGVDFATNTGGQGATFLRNNASSDISSGGTIKGFNNVAASSVLRNPSDYVGISSATDFRLPALLSKTNQSVALSGYPLENSLSGTGIFVYSSGSQATATFTFSDKPNETSTITLTDYESTFKTFEIDNENDGVTTGRIAVNGIASAGGGATGTAADLTAKINASDLKITATNPSAGKIVLTQDLGSQSGNRVISVNDPSHWNSSTSVNVPASFTGAAFKNNTTLGFNSDIAGNPRGSSWSVGAFQYVADPSQSLDLFVTGSGHAPAASGDVDFFTTGSIPVSSGVDFYIKSVLQAESGVNLFLKEERFAKQRDLFLKGSAAESVTSVNTDQYTSVALSSLSGGAGAGGGIGSSTSLQNDTNLFITTNFLASGLSPARSRLQKLFVTGVSDMFPKAFSFNRSIRFSSDGFFPEGKQRNLSAKSETGCDINSVRYKFNKSAEDSASDVTINVTGLGSGTLTKNNSYGTQITTVGNFNGTYTRKQPAGFNFDNFPNESMPYVYNNDDNVFFANNFLLTGWSLYKRQQDSSPKGDVDTETFSILIAHSGFNVTNNVDYTYASGYISPARPRHNKGWTANDNWRANKSVWRKGDRNLHFLR